MSKTRQSDISATRVWAYVLFPIGLLVAWLLPSIVLYDPITEGGEPLHLVNSMQLVGHAGAGLPEGRYTNSEQAVVAAVERGLDFVEIDFIDTADGAIVASHDWDKAYRELRGSHWAMNAALSRLFPRNVPTKSEFMAQEFRTGLKPLDLPSLAILMKQYPDLRIITDIKSDNIVQVLKRMIDTPGLDRDRVIPQIYAPSELRPVRRLGFSRVIYTLYRDPSVDFDEVLAFAARNDLQVTMPLGWVTPQRIAPFITSDVPVLVHTVNDPAQAEQLSLMGVAGVYTDFLLPVISR